MFIVHPTQTNMEEADSFNIHKPDPDFDLSFTSVSSIAATDRTFASSSARSSLTLSFNDRLSTSTSSSHAPFSSSFSRPHRCSSDPNWSAIKAATTLSSSGRLHLHHLKLLRHLGTGNLGRVYLCRLRDCDSASFALKVVDRDHLSPKKLSQVDTEANILSLLDHPFLPTLYARFTASHYTCLLIDYCPGGDLHSLLRRQPSNRLPLNAVRFFAAEVLVAIEYLHALGIVYRDLKPENILLRDNGHVMLSDFDLCFQANVVPTFRTYRRPTNRLSSNGNNDHCTTQRNNAHPRGSSCFGSAGSNRRNERSEEVVAEFVAEPTAAYSQCCVGTHEYLAPELVSGSGHGNGVDWWAFGVLIYELLYGTTPFKGACKEDTLRNIASTKQARFPLPADVYEAEGMTEARDLIEKLLVKDPRRRLGCTGGATDLKRHPFFEGIKWPLIRSYRPPAEVRGLTRKLSKSKGSRHIAGVHRRQRWWWKGLEFFMRAKSSKHSPYGYSRQSSSNHSNGNYYRYFVSNNKHM